jgi:hypothetical protein
LGIFAPALTQSLAEAQPVTIEPQNLDQVTSFELASYETISPLV